MGEASYLRLYRDGELETRIEKTSALMEICHLCPRECGVNRLEGEKGYCRTGRNARIASYNTHFGEEAPLVGRRGSGTIFLSSCNLLCSFCQNYEISHLNEGVEVEPAQMAAMMIQLAERGCHNINFVTPTHAIVPILEALGLAIEQGLNVPLVYNSGGYESIETLTLLDGIFDIYMPDFKFWDDRWGERFCNAPDYGEMAKAAIREMHRQVGDLRVDDEGIAVRGLLIRHLVMPNDVAGTDRVMDFLAREISSDTYVNVMDQYRPCGNADSDALINRRLTSQEFREAVDAAKKAGLSRLDSRERPRIIFGF
jgi:putative pyruvate formate lyase activating enzyme